jgi:glycosyltransferase involved in cell wall biosynthesis
MSPGCHGNEIIRQSLAIYSAALPDDSATLARHARSASQAHRVTAAAAYAKREPHDTDQRKPPVTRELDISFVVPAYNEEALLPRCLAAIAAEIDRNAAAAEIIVVDNASTDGTSEVASRTPGVRVIKERERGLVPARRAGCRAARGRLIANIDADTILPESWLERARAEFARDPNLVGLSGPYIYYDAPRRVQVAAAGFYRFAFVAYVLVRFVMRAGSMMQGGNFVVRRDALEKVGGFESEFRFYGEDTDIARRLSKVGAVKFTFRLAALSSGRRFAAEGVVRVGLTYTANFFWATFRKRPFTHEWRDFRADEPAVRQ